MDDWVEHFISIHSLRVEGDVSVVVSVAVSDHFNPLPPCGGRQLTGCTFCLPTTFQSTPSVWRETLPFASLQSAFSISIHSLRVEGDRRCFRFFPQLQNFNPLPPCGGRHSRFSHSSARIVFQSTPSVWRETALPKHRDRRRPISIHSLRVEGDAAPFKSSRFLCNISIHSLRVEGDLQISFTKFQGVGFQSTPSVWRETFRHDSLDVFIYFNPLPPCGGRPDKMFAAPPTSISIHSLRVEGDHLSE